jgi:LEA14-like dessication related protein
MGSAKICHRVWAGFAAALILCGCAGIFKPIEVPKVELAGIGIQKADFFETVLQLKLRVDNPNRIPLTMKALTCDLTLNDDPVATGISRETVDIPALGSNIVTITVVTSAAKIAATLLRVLSSGAAIDYRLTGKLSLQGGLFMPSDIPFDSRGQVPVKNIFER